MKNILPFYKKILHLLPKQKRSVLFALCFLAVFILHGLALSEKILEIEPMEYKYHAYDLKVTPEYRYGYLWSWYGTILVKSPNSDLSVPDYKRAVLISIKSLENTMRQELNLIPLKTALELIFYIVLLGYAFFGSRRLLMKLHAEERGIFCQYCLYAMLWMIFWTMACLPFSLFGYGEPFHTSAIGPAAIKYDSSPFLLFTGNALTISYRYFISIMTVFPLMFGTVMDYGFQHLPSVRNHILYNVLFLGLLFYGLGGIMYVIIEEDVPLKKTGHKILLLMVCVAEVLILVSFQSLIWSALPDSLKSKISAYNQSYSLACDKYLSSINLYQKGKEWPRTLPEAVNKAISSLSDKDKEIVMNTPMGELTKFHHGWGTGIRNRFGLWKGNKDLLKACGSEKMHPYDASMVIIAGVWGRLKQECKEDKVLNGQTGLFF